MTTRRDRVRHLLGGLGLEGEIGARCGAEGFASGEGAPIYVREPVDGTELIRMPGASDEDLSRVLADGGTRFREWRMRPGPERGALVRRLGELLREHRDALAELVTLEVGKIPSEARGEVQEMIDVCDFAVGLSRQLHGLTIASERPRHRLLEQWHPLGPVGIITAFNFPLAVWAWNAAIAAVCGDVCLWKPSPRAPLSALGAQALAWKAMQEHEAEGVFCQVIGGASLGARMAAEPRIPLVSFTGSTQVGREVAAKVAGRLGRSLLELGGNNACIVMADADLELATRAVVFGAVGTAGQRCTSTRRLFVERPVFDEVVSRLERAYGSVKVGDPAERGVLMGPLVSEEAVASYLDAVERAKAQGGEVRFGGERVDRPGFFVRPTLVVAPRQESFPVAWEETFAPILYVFPFDRLSEAIDAQNATAHGLSSAIFTDRLRHAERFLSAEGSDCGIANVNLGTSGAEIGGAFGGEKDTGGGRESGSDAWKAYMRRQTQTVNWGDTLPLAQGVEFL